MSWVSGVRGTVLYTVQQRPVDPRWSNRDIQTMLGWCATGQHLGWNEERAFQAAEAIVMKSKCHGIRWAHCGLNDDIQTLIDHAETA